jgi:hypothetical protein
LGLPIIGELFSRSQKRKLPENKLLLENGIAYVCLYSIPVKMKKILFILFICLSNSCLAQLPLNAPSQFDKFITDPKIEWAMYNMDSIHFKGQNLSELLRTKFEKKEIKATLAIEIIPPLNQKIIFYSKDEIDFQLFHQHDVPMFDSLGNLIKQTPEQKKSIPFNLFDNGSYNVVDMCQLFYIEHGILKSYVPFVSPKISITTSNGIFLGYSNYFSTCFNYSHHYKPRSGNKVIFLSQTKKMILQDSMYWSGKLKELYGRDLIRTLWPYLLNKKLNIANVETNKKLAIEDIIKDVALNDPARNPSYDSMLLMNIINPYTENLTLSHITSLEVVQDWFYDQTKNIVFNKVRELHVNMRPWKTGDEDKAPAAVFKILF